MVKLHRKGECLDTGSGSDDGDCESGLEQAGESAPEEQVHREAESELESLPVLTAGSFVRYAQHTVVVEPKLLTPPVAGGLCSSTFAQA